MFGKVVLYLAFVFCMSVFPFSVSFAAGHCSHSGKEHKQGGWWNKLTGSGKGKKDYAHGHAGKKDCHGKKYGWKSKHGNHAFWWRGSSMADILKLDEEQVSRMDEIARVHHGTITDASHAAYQARHELYKLMMDPESSEDTIRAAAQNVYVKEMEKKQLTLEKKLAMRATLTPRQIEDLSILGHKGHKRGCSFGKGHR